MYIYIHKFLNNVFLIVFRLPEDRGTRSNKGGVTESEIRESCVGKS